MHATPSPQLPLPDIDAPLRPGCFVNSQLVIYEQDGLRVAVVRGATFHTWPVGDLVAEKVFVVQARQAQVATIEELARALEKPERTLYRAWDAYTSGGVEGLMPRRRGRPKGSADLMRDAVIRRLHKGGLGFRAIARQLKCSPLTVERAHDRMGLERNWVRKRRLFPDDQAPDSAQPANVKEAGGTESSSPAAAPAESEAVERSEPVAAMVDPEAVSPARHSANNEEPLPCSIDSDPLDRSLDRFLATQGAIDDAAPLFAPGENLPWVGALLAIPALVSSGLLVEARRLYGDIGPAFYGLRTTLVAVVLLSLLRVKRPEHLKEYAPAELGRILGLDRVPEVKTLRKKIRQLAAGPSEDLVHAVTRQRALANEDATAWLYVDGHVRVYSGKERLSKTHVARMRISQPATQDMWVHDGDGCPVLLVTQEAHPSLASALTPVLEASRKIVGDRRITAVFDRGGWSPDLFADLLSRNVDVLTYRKGTSDPIPVSWFEPRPGRPGEPLWMLHDASVRLPNGLWMRQITRLVGDHQTAIVTTRQDLPAEVLAWRMFNRWRQENFFKYMRQEFDLDGLCEYGAEEEDPLREVPNPEWAGRDRVLRKARADLQATLARTLDDKHPDAVAATETMTEARRQRDALPRRVKVGELPRPTVRLPARLKNLYDGLKAVAWQIETDLVRALAPFYSRNDDEGRTLISAAFRSAGSLQLDGAQLVVTLKPQSSPHRTRAIAGLCHLLDQTETCFPGTRLRLRYRIEGADGADLASPTATSNAR